MAKYENVAFEIILDDFHKSKKKEISANYSSLGKAFEYLNDIGASDVEKDFRDLLPKLIVAGRKDDIIKLIKFIRCTISKYRWAREEDGGALDNAKTYLQSFLNYVEKLTSNNKKFAEILDSLKPKTLSLNENDINKLDMAFKNRIIYSHKELRNKFKSRLRCQDRVSGDKTWLPLRFIAKLYSIEKKTNKRDINLFSQWLDSLVDSVYVHYCKTNKETDGGKVKSANFKDDKLYLELLKNKESDEYKVFVVLSKKGRRGHYYPALTPIGKGNMKDEMVVKSISEIDIDHIKPIDQTLRDLKNLSDLEKVSEYYKKLTEQDDVDENKAAVVLLSNKEISLSLDGLRNDLDRIREDGLLRLMDSNYNSLKSNGSTFKRIIKNGHVYWGIIEDENIKDCNGNAMYLVQKLTDSNIQNNFLVAAPTTYKFLKNNNPEKVDLKKIINFI